MKEKKIDLKSIPYDKLTTITISGSFYQRLNKMFTDYSESQPKEKLLQALVAIKHDKAGNNDFSFNIETLLILMKTLDEAFESQGDIVVEEINVEVPDDHDDTKVMLPFDNETFTEEEIEAKNKESKS